MKNLMKTGAYLLLSMSLSMGISSCGDDDPDYSNVTPPTVTVVHSISGRVTAMNGEGLQATVSMEGTSVTTKADGTFAFENVKAGNYTLKAEAKGKISKEGVVTVSENGKSDNPVWNVVLANEGTSVKANADGSAAANVVSETIKGNESGEVEVVMTAPANAVPAGSSIVITPIYTQGEAMVARSRAASDLMLIGTNVSCSDAGATLTQPLQLEYDVEPTVAAEVKAQKLVNGKWIDADFTVEGDKVTVVADQFTSYTLLLGTTVTSSVTTENLNFTPNNWDNLYGSNEMTVASAGYSYKIGSEVTTSGTNRVTAYLIEMLARMAGSGVVTANGTYPLDVTLPIGTAMSISGQQSVTTLSVSALGRTASGKQYGDVSVVTRTWNREHTGGSGGNL